ncbi:hypothetical protein E2C01_080970 [Portunus trituberculatus]|uniref:Uncharacterized protein n=1 Tax=Portunus trituberculatus TaxID=210409 RepID=A0A5B7J107_PORTR|nr:hypothetical protein [Portunus trituberculatus]
MRDGHLAGEVLGQQVHYILILNEEFPRFFKERRDGGDGVCALCVLHKVPPLFGANVSAPELAFFRRSRGVAGSGDGGEVVRGRLGGGEG